MTLNLAAAVVATWFGSTSATFTRASTLRELGMAPLQVFDPLGAYSLLLHGCPHWPECVASWRHYVMTGARWKSFSLANKRNGLGGTILVAMSRQLKIAQFVDNYGPAHNGLLIAVQQLEGDLLSRGHEVIVVAPKAKGRNPHQGNPNREEIRLPSVVVPKLPVRIASGRKFTSTIKKIGKLQPDVIHVHGFGPIGVLGLWSAVRHDIPLVVTWHTDFDAYAEHYPAILPVLRGVVRLFAQMNRSEVYALSDIKQARLELGDNASLLGLMRRMLTEANIVTAPSPKTQSRALLLAPGADVRCVPNGVDKLPAGPAPIERGTGPLIMYAGRIAPEKGLTLLFDAFELVAEIRPDAQLMVVGDWEHTKSLRRRLAKMREKYQVILPGEQPHSELGAYYAMADVFAFPSTTDTQALVLHEAALAGLPIVLADTELDLVIEPGVNGEFGGATPIAFAAALLKVIDRLADPAWSDRARSRSQELAGQWNLESQAEAMMDIYEELSDRH
ncbi:glycosyltransferase [Corynebacterium hindlerae]|uniref:Glycosyltransferase n=1 Tax=Corynebacterium hindlerae TaxID=699041 RepID=A0A7G5FDY1_9CORY|nr:glycosyltransferase [Corynebacterium hindlerae]QMV84822.1 glycosyltransferase [Corynebacterium hindlerae]